MQMHLQREILTYISRICKSCPHYLWNHRKKKNFSFLMFMFHIYELNCKSCFHVFLVIFYHAQSYTCSIIHLTPQTNAMWSFRSVCQVTIGTFSTFKHPIYNIDVLFHLYHKLFEPLQRLYYGLDYKRYHLTYRITTYI